MHDDVGLKYAFDEWTLTDYFASRLTDVSVNLSANSIFAKVKAFASSITAPSFTFAPVTA